MAVDDEVPVQSVRGTSQPLPIVPFEFLSVDLDGNICVAPPGVPGDSQPLQLGAGIDTASPVLACSGWVEDERGWPWIAQEAAEAARRVGTNAGNGAHTEYIDQLANLLRELPEGMYVAAVVVPRARIVMVRSDSLGRHPVFYKCEERRVALRISKPPPGPNGSDDGWWHHAPRTVAFLQVGSVAAQVLLTVPLLPEPLEAPCGSQAHAAPKFRKNAEPCACESSESVVERHKEEDLAISEFLARLSFAVRRALMWGGALEESLEAGVSKRPVAVLFSGGVDSTMLAALCKHHGADVRLYTAGFWMAGCDEPEDIVKAREAAKWLEVPWVPCVRNLEETKRDMENLAPLIADLDVVKMGVALAFSAACDAAAASGAMVALSGGGSEELLSGYCLRHLNRPREHAEAAGLSGLRTMWHRDLQRDFAVGAHHGLRVIHPYLDGMVAPFTVALPHTLKVWEQEKALLRWALKTLGAPESSFARRKRAAQYGSRFHQALEKLGKMTPERRRANLVCNPAIGFTHCSLALIHTSGKESCHAYQCLKMQQCSFTCVLGFNPDGIAALEAISADLFAACVQLPLDASLPLYLSRFGPRPENRVKEMAAVLRAASLRHKFAGVVCGHASDIAALTELEEACDLAGLKCCSPVGSTSRVCQCLVQESGPGSELLITRSPASCPLVRPGDVITDVASASRLQQWFEEEGIPYEAESGRFDAFPIRSVYYSGRELSRRESASSEKIAESVCASLSTEDTNELDLQLFSAKDIPGH